MKHRVLAGVAACLVLVLTTPALAGRHGPPGGGGMEEFVPPGWRQAGKDQDKEMRRLRELRLKEAIRYGDLSREEARQQRPPPREYWPAPGNSAGEERGGPENKRRYWRDKRRQANERDQDD